MMPMLRDRRGRPLNAPQGLSVGWPINWEHTLQGQRLRPILMEIAKQAVIECHYHRLECGVGSCIAVNLEPAPIPPVPEPQPDMIVVRHGYNEAVRIWPIDAAETTFAEELVAWLREVHGYENYQPLPQSPPKPPRHPHQLPDISLFESQVRDLLPDDL